MSLKYTSYEKQCAIFVYVLVCSFYHLLYEPNYQNHYERKIEKMPVAYDHFFDMYVLDD